MAPEEADSIYVDLRGLLEGNGFSWVLENVDAILSYGVPERHTLPRYRETVGGAAPVRSVRVQHETVIGMRPQTEKEQLVLLLDEIGRCIIQPIRIASDLRRTLSPTDIPLDMINLVDPENGVEFRIDATEELKWSLVDRLEAMIETIRSRLNHAT